ncbi:MAG: sulfotransferase domain-containing protein, partial [Bradymonadaceae bacterium]
MFNSLADAIDRTYQRVTGTPDIDRFALIIGAMKSGTTSLFNYLSEHPEIAPCRMAEPHFFAKPLKWKKGLDWYRDLWDWEPVRHTVALEASTNYAKGFKFEGVPDRIAKAAESGLDFRFLYIMRHPVDRLVSQYNHGVRSGWNDPPEDPS